MLDYQEILNTCLETINISSKIVMDYYHNGFLVDTKEDKSFVTNADIESQKAIISNLKAKYPDFGFLAEESKDDFTRLNKDYVFIIDPIDGTKDFVNKTDEFAINIALSYKSEIVIGIIAVPAKNIIYYAIKGQGAYKIENASITKIETSKKNDNLIMVASRYFFTNDGSFTNKGIVEIKTVGSAYKFGLIAEGKADIAIKLDDKTKEWDIAPGVIIIKEAGGIVCDLYGKEFVFNKKDVFNRNGFIVCNNKQLVNRFSK